LIEQVYTQAAQRGLDLWCEDEAGPFKTAPVPDSSWQPEGHPAHDDHEYMRRGTAKLLTLLHPLDGRVAVKAARQSTNAVLLPWLQSELAAALARLPPAATPTLSPAEQCAFWERWEAGLQVRITLPASPPPL
jgi:hypothetical protein